MADVLTEIGDDLRAIPKPVLIGAISLAVVAAVVMRRGSGAAPTPPAVDPLPDMGAGAATVNPAQGQAAADQMAALQEQINGQFSTFEQGISAALLSRDAQAQARSEQQAAQLEQLGSRLASSIEQVSSNNQDAVAALTAQLHTLQTSHPGGTATTGYVAPGTSPLGNDSDGDPRGYYSDGNYHDPKREPGGSEYQAWVAGGSYDPTNSG